MSFFGRVVGSEPPESHTRQHLISLGHHPKGFRLTNGAPIPVLPCSPRAEVGEEAGGTEDLTPEQDAERNSSYPSLDEVDLTAFH